MNDENKSPRRSISRPAIRRPTPQPMKAAVPIGHAKTARRAIVATEDIVVADLTRDSRHED